MSIHPRAKHPTVLRLRQNFSSASRAALYEKLRTCKAMLRRERQEKVEMKDDAGNPCILAMEL